MKTEHDVNINVTFGNKITERDVINEKIKVLKKTGLNNEEIAKELDIEESRVEGIETNSTDDDTTKKQVYSVPIELGNTNHLPAFGLGLLAGLVLAYIFK